MAVAAQVVVAAAAMVAATVVVRAPVVATVLVLAAEAHRQEPLAEEVPRERQGPAAVAAALAARRQPAQPMLPCRAPAS